MNRLFRRLLFLTLMSIATITISAQGARLQINHLDRLEAKAAHVVNVDVDEKLLQIAAKFLSSDEPDEAAVKELVMGLKGVFVRSYEFERENEFTDGDIQAITSQLRDSRWTRMVDVRSKREGETVEVYTMLDGSSNMEGLAVLAVDPKQLTIVNIVGPVDIDKLSKLSGKFGIPKLRIERGPSTKKEQ